MNTKINEKDYSVKLIEAFTSGIKVTCPVCMKPLRTIPSKLNFGERPLGLVCSDNERHFLVYEDNSESLTKARSALRRIAKEQ